MSVIGSNILAGASGQAGAAGAFQIERSLRFNSADSTSLSRDMSAASSTYTFSTWIKRADVSGSQFQYIFASGAAGLSIHTSNTFYVFDGSTVQQTTGVFRDPSAWYHLVFSVNSGSFTLYVNGVSVKTGTAASLSTTANATSIGRYMGTGSGIYYLDAYLAEVHFIDGQALAQTDFGEYDDNNVWQPKAYSGTYGTNGFHLDFSDNSSASALGTDAAGSNNWTVSNLSVASGAGNDSLIDTPMNYEADSGNNGGNYATLNPLESALTGLNNGNLNSGSSGAASWKICTSTMAVSSGKYYWEGFTTQTATESAGWQFGFCQIGPSSLTAPYGTGKWSYQHGTVYNQSSSGTSVGTTAGANDLLAYALDMGAGTCKLYVNDSLVHTFTGITGTITPFVGSYSTPTVTVNFGQRPFSGTVPTGHVSWCTQNLSESAYASIADGSTAFDVALDTGANILSSTKALCNNGADFLWIKDRANASTNHHLIDIVRDTQLDGTPFLASNSTSTESTLGTYSAPSGNSVGWAWDGGTSTVSNTDGTITTSVRANASAGFSIISYAGSDDVGTIGHGLGAEPYFGIFMNRDVGEERPVYHKSLGNTKDLIIHSPVKAGVTSHWNNTTPTSSVISLGYTGAVNESGSNYIAWVWAPIEGFSAFGSYNANDSDDGPFVYTGFRPKLVIIKLITETGANWLMFDTERDPHNVFENVLFANSNAAEEGSTTRKIDFLSNGFKLRSHVFDTNDSTYEYMFAAWAEHPFKTARAR